MLAACIVSTGALADSLVGSDSFLCYGLSAARCDNTAACEETQPWCLNIPDFLWIDLGAMLARTTGDPDQVRTTPIASVDRSDGRITLQGTQGDRAFSWIIVEETSEGTLTVSSPEFGLIVYPSEEQSAEQQAKDESECIAWGRDTTGIDPADPMAGVRPPPRASQSGEGLAAASGALRGATRGALIGNLGDRDGGDWALGGALIGSIRGAKQREEQNRQAAEAATAQAQEQQSERMETFKRAFSVCMQAREYVVG